MLVYVRNLFNGTTECEGQQLKVKNKKRILSHAMSYYVKVNNTFLERGVL